MGLAVEKKSQSFYAIEIVLRSDFYGSCLCDHDGGLSGRRAGNKALPTWLIATYVLQEVGEICFVSGSD